MNRRSFVESLGIAVTFPSFSALAAAPRKSDREAIQKMAEAFLKQFGVHGMAVAYGKAGKIAFEQGYGFADAQGKEAVKPEHLFRIASVSKPVTSAAVMMSVEQGLLKLESKVFGPQGLLGEAYGNALPERLTAITVDHLLTHTGGWSKETGEDPMFMHPGMKHAELIAWALANQKQTDAPGTKYAYSNFGYCVLGRVLEKVTKLPYEAFVKQQVLARCGITGMKIAGNTLKERQPHEVMYHDANPDLPYGMNVARMDAHGGWLATAADLVRFASRLRKTGPQNGLLSEKTIQTMTTDGAVNAGYARGWAVNKVPNWWHSGSLPGTSSILVHTAGGLCWAALVNGRAEGIDDALDKLMWKMGELVMGGKL